MKGVVVLILLGVLVVSLSGCAEMDEFFKGLKSSETGDSFSARNVSLNMTGNAGGNITGNATINLTSNATTNVTKKEQCPANRYENDCPDVCDECKPRENLSDGTRCMQCITYECPENSFLGKCPDECDYCDSVLTLPNKEECIECVKYSCPANTWKTEEECLRKCPQQYESCKIAIEQGEAVCWGCSELDCESWCASQGLPVYTAGAWSDYIVEYLNKNGYCKSEASIVTNKLAQDGCICAMKPEISIGQQEVVCAKTPCGDVPCGETASCVIDRIQLTVSCSWNGWQWQGGDTYTAIFGTNST
ncbi:hypothetical protein KY308_04120 [Candidatus Woesearchaeota archaeon]|nr:hypothetical protein [Candidatus Woesearchaeota archaeon]